MPNFRYHCGPPPAGLMLTQNFGNPQPRLTNKKGAILEIRGSPRIFVRFWKIAGNLSPSGEVLFRNLISDKNSPFSASFLTFSRGADFYPKFGQPSAAISSKKRGHIGDTWVVQDPPKFSDKSWKIYHRLGRPYFEP